ncbi:sensor domain-containing diguanylate cyclase [Psychromonas sp. PT13]|uniref:sensor domain-containing diguanylate cyclase n=1 Tax=Psychromonas sp. PT13 TaxID=3439547 RepID=UPI003EBBAA3F
MKPADIPENEAKRLETLKSLDVLDTPAEERFDRITRMAERMFNVPIALVTLVDENRQWFKSCLGLTFNEAPREISFCGHAILDDDVFIIYAASKDERFADNPMVTGEPYVEFYAGCPLIVNGYRLGTLCIVDHVTRTFNSDDIAALKDLAATVEIELSALQLATHDDLTGILNRRGFISLANNTLNLSLRNTFPVVLVYLDVDKFKAINDRFGHATGDFVLTSFANLLSASLRESDIIARLGGDEFIILLSSISLKEAKAVIDEFQNALNSYLKSKQPDLAVSFSSGIVEFDHNKHATIEAFLCDADTKMYSNKHATNK